jgi:aspartyl aminopeptidase
MKKHSDNLLEISKKFALEIVEGLNESVTHFHAVDYMKKKLINHGFNELCEKESWKLQKGGKYFYTRNHSALVAFTIGKLTNLNKTCFKIIGGHTDSPNLRFAPNSYTTCGKWEKVILNLIFS